MDNCQQVMLTDGKLDKSYGIKVEKPYHGYMPFIRSEANSTINGTSYLQSPGVAVISAPEVDIHNLRDFIDGFNPDCEFDDYLRDTSLPHDSDQLCKTAGQICYMALGSKRTHNSEAGKYFDNIKSRSHLSITEHANFSFLFYGVSRSCTMELIRHRILSFSQVSQRYVDGSVLRFVERPEYCNDEDLHSAFLKRIDRIKAEYVDITSKLAKKYADNNTVPKLSKTDLRKAMQQVSRSVLPNETEAPIIVTGNARAWRHFLDMRASLHAEPEIRRLAVYVYFCLREVSSHLFSDYKVERLPDDSLILTSPYQEKS